MADVAVREEDILQKFKINKIKKRSGELSGEKLFKPITRRLEKTPDAEAAEEEEDEEPDYVMDEFDRTNPFAAEFMPDAATLPPTPPLPDYEVDDDFPPPPPPPPISDDSDARKTWEERAAPELHFHKSFAVLSTVYRLITK